MKTGSDPVQDSEVVVVDKAPHDVHASSQEFSGVTVSSVAQAILDLFEESPREASQRFHKSAADKAAATAILRFLVDKRRPDVVLAITEGIPMNERTFESIVIERARAVGQVRSAEAADEFLAPVSRKRRAEYAFQYNAGKLLMELHAPALALPHLEAAFGQKRTPAAIDRIFMCQMALARFRQAANALSKILDIGDFRESLKREFAVLLLSVKPGALDPSLVRKLGREHAADPTVGPALLPHLVKLDIFDAAVAALESNSGDLRDCDEKTLLSIISYFDRRDRDDLVMIIAQRSGGVSEAIPKHFATRFNSFSVSDIHSFLHSSRDAEGIGSPAVCITLAERLAELGDMKGALETLGLIDEAAVINPEQFYAYHKDRLAQLVSAIVARIGEEPSVRLQLAKFVAFWVQPEAKAFLASPRAKELIRDLLNINRAATLTEAASRRLALLQEGYFEYYIERRLGRRLQRAANDFELCDLALRYFGALSGQLSTDTVPIGRSLLDRLLKPALSAGPGREIDVLTAFALLRERPNLNATGSRLFGQVCWWFLTAFLPANNVPVECINPAMLSYCNEVLSTDEFSGLNITRFLDLIWVNSELYKERFDRKNVLDRVLFVANLLGSLLPNLPQYIPLFRPILMSSKEQTRLPLNIAVLCGDFAHKVQNDNRVAVPKVREGRADDRREILVIGHASKSTGLGRNFRMIQEGLHSETTAVAGLDFELDPEDFTREFDAWRSRRPFRPLVVLAVNAQDVPEIYTRDLSGTLADCYSIGFFLWETSRVPLVQRLGVSLVDEIWSPTAYVAGIYSSLKPTHVVGKGLFRTNESTPWQDRQKSRRTTFLTIFDFDSSIERKNHLAVVQAFQTAFDSGETVELVVKTSTINPDHWGNALGQWEGLSALCSADRRIKLITSRYSDEQMVQLIRNASCLVSLHRAEGFGYVIADAMAYGTPVIATDYSGNVDFCTEQTSYPVSYRLVPVDSRAAFWKPDGAEWAEPDIASAATQMRRVYENYSEALEKAKYAQTKIFSDYSVDRFRATLQARLAAVQA